MTNHVLVAELLGVLLALTGFTLAFRQAQVRRGLDAMRARRGLPPLPPVRTGGEDPIHYALIISGTMVMALGLIVIGFTTMYALAT